MTSGNGTDPFQTPYPKKRVLIVSCVPRMLAEMKKDLLAYFEINIAATTDTALAALKTYGADAVLAHLNNSCGMSPSVFSILSQYTTVENIPLLFIADQDDEQDEADAFELGASDFFIKRKSFGKAFIQRISLRTQVQEGFSLLSGNPSPETLLNGKTILIAEDVELNREIISEMFAEVTGLTLEFAANGAEAVKMYTEYPHRYALIFMDIQMPEMDGLSATRAIRELSSAQMKPTTVPIIALTASVEEKDIAEFRAAGMTGYLKKPMDYHEFIHMCAAYCSPQ